ncbi:MAG: GNAT family N-acetyltransferase, partial [Ruminococcus sp.]
MLKDCKIVKAELDDAEEILNLYGTHLGGPAGWSENYPNKDTVKFDLHRDALFVMKNSLNEIIATIT